MVGERKYGPNKNLTFQEWKNEWLERTGAKDPWPEILCLIVLVDIDFGIYDLVEDIFRCSFDIEPSRGENVTKNKNSIQGLSKVMQAALQVWVNQPQWKKEDTKNALYYMRDIIERQALWQYLDIDHVDNRGIRYYGSLFRQRNRNINSREPDEVLSLDVMQDMEMQRSENDKEAFYSDGWEEHITESHAARSILLDKSGEAVTNKTGDFIYLESSPIKNRDILKNDNINHRGEWDNITGSRISEGYESVQSFDDIKHRDPDKKKLLKAKDDAEHIQYNLMFNDKSMLHNTITGNYSAGRIGFVPTWEEPRRAINQKAIVILKYFLNLIQCEEEYNVHTINNDSNGYYNNNFQLKFEHEKIIYSSCIPKHKHKNIDSALIDSVENDIIARLDTESAIMKAGLNPDDVAVALSWENVKNKDSSAEYLNSIEPNEWTRHLFVNTKNTKTTFPPLISSLDQCFMCGKISVYNNIRCKVILPDGGIGYKCNSMEPPAAINVKIDCLNEPSETLTAITNLTLHKPLRVKKENSNNVQWNNKRAAAAKQRIKRAISNDKLKIADIRTYDSISIPLIEGGFRITLPLATDLQQYKNGDCCWKCNCLTIHNKPKNDGGSYIRQYTCNKGHEVKSLYNKAGECFTKSSIGEQNKKNKKLMV